MQTLTEQDLTGFEATIKNIKAVKPAEKPEDQVVQLNEIITKLTDQSTRLIATVRQTKEDRIAEAEKTADLQNKLLTLQRGRNNDRDQLLKISRMAKQVDGRNADASLSAKSYLDANPWVPAAIVSK